MGVSVTFFFAFSGSSLGLDPRGLAVLAMEPMSCVYTGGVESRCPLLCQGKERAGRGKKQGFLCNSEDMNLPQCEPYHTSAPA